MRRNRTTKPAGNVSTKIDWTHPLARGLVGCWIFSQGSNSARVTANPAARETFRDLVYGTPLLFNITTNSNMYSGVVPSSFGLGVRFNHSDLSGATSADCLKNDAPPPQLQPTKEVSFFWRGCFYNNIGGFNFTSIFRVDATSTGATSPFTSYGVSRTSNVGEIRYEHDAGGAFNGLTVSPPPCAAAKYGTPFSLGLSRSADGPFTKCYAAGIKVASDTVAGNLTYPSPDIRINTDGTIGNQQIGSTAIDVLYVWNRALSDFEQAWIDQHPYELLVTPFISRPFPIVAAGATVFQPETTDYQSFSLMPHWARRSTQHQEASDARIQGPVKIIPPLPFPGTRDFDLPLPHLSAFRAAYLRAAQFFKGEQGPISIIVPDPPAKIAHQAAEPQRLQPLHYRLWQPPQILQPLLAPGAQVISVLGVPTGFAAGTAIVKGPLQTIFPRGLTAGAVGTPGVAGGDTSFSCRINGIERNVFVQRGTCQVQRQLSGRASCTFVMQVNTAAYVPNVDDRVVIQESGILWFAGSIDQAVQSLQMSTAANYEHQISCVDTNTVADRRFVFQEYNGGIERDIILDVVEHFLSGEGITTNNVEGYHLNFADLVYHGVPVTQVFDQIATATGDQWYIDFFNDLHFKAVGNGRDFSLVPGGYSLATDNQKYRNLQITRTRSKYRNVQYVRSDQFLVVSTRQETFTSLGLSPAAFITEFSIRSTPVIKVNGVVQTVLNELFSTPGANLLGWYWLQNGYGVFNQISPPAAGAVIEVDYNSFLSNIIEVTDPVQIAARQASGGGSGRYEALEEVKGADTADATFIASGLLRRYSQGGYPATIQYENDFPPPAPGDLIPVNLPEFAINAPYLVQEVRSRHMGAPLKDGTSFRSTIKLVSSEDQGSGLAWFENLLARTRQGDPSVVYEYATFILAPGGGLTTGNNGANPYIVKQTCEFAEMKVIAGVAPVSDMFRCDILRSVAGLGSPASIFAKGKFAEVPVASTDLQTYGPSQVLATVPLIFNKDDVLTPSVILANGSAITLLIALAIRGKGALG